MPFQKGNQLSKGVAKKGMHHIGRPTNEFKAFCKKLLSDSIVLQFLEDVAKGKDIDRVVTLSGKVISVPPKLRDRIEVIRDLADRAHGKATQPIAGVEDEPITFSVVHYAEKPEKKDVV